MKNSEYQISFSRNPVSGGYSYMYKGEKSLFGRKGIYTGGFTMLKEIFKEEITRLNSVGSPEVKLIFSKDPSILELNEISEIKDLFSKNYLEPKNAEFVSEKSLESITA